MDPANPRFCVNCRHCVEARPSMFECHAPQNRTQQSNLVTGEPTPSWRYRSCEAQRAAGPHGNGQGDNCSIAGRWYEPRVEQEAAE